MSGLVKLIDQTKEELEKYGAGCFQSIIKVRHIRDTSPSDIDKYFATLHILIQQESILLVQVSLILLEIIATLDARTDGLESERGKREIELDGLKEVRKFLQEIREQRKQMEKAGAEMFG